MKRTQTEDLFATIRATIVSFFSIIMFVALAVAIFLGIDWSGRALEASGENAFEAGSFHDLEILYPYGLTDDDVAALEQVEGVSEVETGQVTFEMVTVGNEAYSMRIASLSERIDTPLMVEGELPSASNEIAVEALWARRHKLNIGDHLVIKGYEAEADEAAAGAGAEDTADADATGEAADTSKKLTCGDFVITAFMENPAFLSNSANTWGASTTATGTIDVLSWVPLSSFNQEAFEDGNMLVTVRSDELRGLTASSTDYRNGSSALASRVKELGNQQSASRHDELVAKAENKLVDAEAKLDDARTQISDAEQAIVDGEAQIADGEAQIAEAEPALAAKWSEYYAALASGQAALDEKAAALAEAQSIYDTARAELDEKQAAYAAAMKALDDEEAKLDPSAPGYEEARAAIEAKRQELLAQKPARDAAEAELASKKAALDEGYAAYNTAVATFNEKQASAVAQLNAAQAQLESGKTQLEEGKQTIAEKREELADAKDTLADKEAEFADALTSFQNLKDNAYSWNVRTRAENGGVVSLESFTDIASRLCMSMASLFVLVGLFVCYSAIARLVREQIRQIGAKKALGMRAREVTVTFLLYAGVAVLVGGLLGVLGAVIVVERIIVPVLTSSFFPEPSVWWSVPYALVFCAVELVLILLSTWLACRTVLKHHAVELLSGGRPPRSDERFFERWNVWQRLPLYTQTTVNNLLNDRRRVFGTLVGVAGCTALIVCSITLNDDIIAGFNNQYADVYHYDTIVRLNTDEEGSLEQAQKGVAELGCPGSTPVATRSVSLNLPDDTIAAGTITVPLDMDSYQKLVTLTSVSGDTAGQQVTPDESGVWISNAYADHFGVKPGDTLTVTVGNGTSYDLPIAGFFTHYLAGHQIVMNADLYNDIFDTDVTASKLLVDRGEVEFEQIEDALDGESYISATIDDRTDQETLFNSFRKVSRVVVVVYLVLSIAMAIVVLLNLNVMFVEEKRRDLTTLMVCGYTVADAKRYVWRDNVVLTFLGVIIGIVLGMITGYLAIQSMELPTISLVESPVLRACLIGAAASFVLSTIMTLIALRAIPHLELSDINRT